MTLVLPLSTLRSPNSMKVHVRPDSVYLLTFAYAASVFSSGILIPIYAFFVQKIGGGIIETSSTIAVSSMIYGFGIIILYKTSWGDTHPRLLLWFGWFLWLLSLILYLVMSYVTILYVSQIVGDDCVLYPHGRYKIVSWGEKVI